MKSYNVFLPIRDWHEQRLICATHDNFADTWDLSEWGFWDTVLLRKNMSLIEVQAIRFSAARKKIWWIQWRQVNLVFSCTSKSFCVHDRYTDASVHAIFQALDDCHLPHRHVSPITFSVKRKSHAPGSAMWQNPACNRKNKSLC